MKSSKRIIVTGGLGYIGSHTVIALQEKGYQPIIIDDLSNSTPEVLNAIAKIAGFNPEFHLIDLRNKSKVQDFFRNKRFDGIIHFAASKAVGESLNKPLLYYENNVCGLINILDSVIQKDKVNFIFSSSCTVYGQADKLPIKETAEIKRAESPYGNTKQIGEEVLQDICKVEKHIKVVSLRYFNPIGAHSSAEIGELPIGTPQNLVPYITQTAIGQLKELSVFGKDYPTPDGTAIRDYIHVMDLAEAHVVALERLLLDKEKENFEIYNLGTGQGTSVLEIIKVFEKSTGNKLAYKISGRREGDVTAAYANTDKVFSELKWRPRRSLEEALQSAWEWQKKIHEKDL